VVADWTYSGNGLDTFNAFDSLASSTYEFDSIIFPGDYAYEFWSSNGQLGDEFLQQMQKYDTKWPLMLSAGNHEDNFNFTFFNEKFRYPGYEQT
jgi:acid phosphatase type 7